MNPTLGFALGEQQLQVASYSLLLSLGALVASAGGFTLAVRWGLPWPRVLACLLAAALAAPVGARLLDAATKPVLYLQEPDRLWRADFEGFSMLGGLLLAGAAGATACRLLSLPAARMADAVAPALWVGVGLARAGCYLAGCCFGEVTSVPWGVTFPLGSPAHLHQLVHSLRPLPPLPVHPTQLYEMAAALACAALAAGLIRLKVPEGAPFLASVCAFAAFRLVNHQFRLPGPALAVPEEFYPALYLLILVTTAGALLRSLATPWRGAAGPPRCSPR
jgi:phosphatidylglycerol---prolipoprotein diacylglyceryl transferase